MYYTIYKITNKINSKYYIGKHQTSNLDDGYMGSGKLLIRAINKHGVENFIKEILHIFDSEEEMNAKEKELVVISEQTYNLCPGGHGGFGYINQAGLGMDSRKAKKMSDLGKQKCQDFWKSDAGKQLGRKLADKAKHHMMEKYPQGTFKNKNHLQETKDKIGKANMGKVPWNKGRPRTEEEKKKIRDGVLKKLTLVKDVL